MEDKHTKGAPADQLTDIVSDRLEHQGRRLFRWRGYVPVPLLAALLIWVYLRTQLDLTTGSHLAWDLFCLGVGLVGLAGCAWVSGCVPVDASGRDTDGQLAARLNTSGPYSLVCHPLYIGSLVMWIATAMFSRFGQAHHGSALDGAACRHAGSLPLVADSPATNELVPRP